MTVKTMVDTRRDFVLTNIYSEVDRLRSILKYIKVNENNHSGVAKDLEAIELRLRQIRKLCLS